MFSPWSCHLWHLALVVPSAVVTPPIQVLITTNIVVLVQTSNMVRMWLILWIILVCDLAPVLLADCPATYISKRGTTYDVKCLDWSRTHRLQQAFITRQSPCFSLGGKSVRYERKSLFDDEFSSLNSSSKVCFLHRTNFRLLGQCQCETSGCGCNSNPASSTSTTTVGMTVTTEPSKTTTQTTTSSLNLVSGEHCKSGKVAEVTLTILYLRTGEAHKCRIYRTHRVPRLRGDIVRSALDTRCVNIAAPLILKNALKSAEEG